jgi:drug/metabolite transporter (DMT)-like permease
MSLLAMAMVLSAALLHAVWNYLVKSNENKELAMSGVVMGHTVFALVSVLVSPLPLFASVPFILFGALLHTAYQFSLLTAYRHGDLSQVYPLARGIAPLLVALLSFVFLQEPLTTGGFAAFVLIGSGILILALGRRGKSLQAGKGARYALITGGCIAGYSMVDGIGARMAGTALGFYGWLSLLNALMFCFIGRIRYPGLILKTCKENWRGGLAGGSASFTAYALVVTAFTVAPIALVTALRETSIIFATLLGTFLLKEHLSLTKLTAIVCTLGGVILLRITG